MRNLTFVIIFLVNPLWSILYAQVTTPNGTSVDYQIYSEGNVAQLENDAAQWLSERGWTSYVTRVGAATTTYNCHSYAWYKSQGGTYNYWINAFLSTDLANFNMYSYYSTPPSPNNIQKYWIDESYIEVPEGEATKVWYGSSWQWTGFQWTNAYDHSAVKLASGLYESKWGAWPLYVHPADKCPYAIGNRRYFKKAPYIYGSTANTDGIIHKLVTVFADHCFLPGYCPPRYPDTLSCIRQFCNRDKFLLSIEVCEPGAAPLLSTRFTTGDKFVIPI
jgi:hypothetical protein